MTLRQDCKRTVLSKTKLNCVINSKNTISQCLRLNYESIPINNSTIQNLFH